MNEETRQERRERRRKNARKMVVEGKSTKLLQRIIVEKSRTVESKDNTDGSTRKPSS